MDNEIVYCNDCGARRKVDAIYGICRKCVDRRVLRDWENGPPIEERLRLAKLQISKARTENKHLRELNHILKLRIQTLEKQCQENAAAMARVKARVSSSATSAAALGAATRWTTLTITR